MAARQQLLLFIISCSVTADALVTLGNRPSTVTMNGIRKSEQSKLRAQKDESTH